MSGVARGGRKRIEHAAGFVEDVILLHASIVYDAIFIFVEDAVDVLFLEYV